MVACEVREGPHGGLYRLITLDCGSSFTQYVGGKKLGRPPKTATCVFHCAPEIVIACSRCSAPSTAREVIGRGAWCFWRGGWWCPACLTPSIVPDRAPAPEPRPAIEED